MGNGQTRELPPEGVVTIVLEGGRIMEYRKPVLVSDLMLLHPHHHVVKPDFFRSSPAVVFSPEEVLMPGNKFLVVPFRTVYRKLHKRVEVRNTPSSANSPKSRASGGRPRVEVLNRPASSNSGKIAPTGSRGCSRVEILSRLCSCNSGQPSSTSGGFCRVHQTGAVTDINSSRPVFRNSSVGFGKKGLAGGPPVGWAAVALKKSPATSIFQAQRRSSGIRVPRNARSKPSIDSEEYARRRTSLQSQMRMHDESASEFKETGGVSGIRQEMLDSHAQQASSHGGRRKGMEQQPPSSPSGVKQLVRKEPERRMTTTGHALTQRSGHNGMRQQPPSSPLGMKQLARKEPELSLKTTEHTINRMPSGRHDGLGQQPLWCPSRQKQLFRREPERSFITNGHALTRSGGHNGLGQQPLWSPAGVKQLVRKEPERSLTTTENTIYHSDRQYGSGRQSPLSPSAQKQLVGKEPERSLSRSGHAITNSDTKNGIGQQPAWSPSGETLLVRKEPGSSLTTSRHAINHNGGHYGLGQQFPSSPSGVKQLVRKGPERSFITNGRTINNSGRQYGLGEQPPFSPSGEEPERCLTLSGHGLTQSGGHNGLEQQPPSRPGAKQIGSQEPERSLTTSGPFLSHTDRLDGLGQQPPSEEERPFRLEPEGSLSMRSEPQQQQQRMEDQVRCLKELPVFQGGAGNNEFVHKAQDNGLFKYSVEPKCLAPLVKRPETKAAFQRQSPLPLIKQSDRQKLIDHLSFPTSQVHQSPLYVPVPAAGNNPEKKTRATQRLKLIDHLILDTSPPHNQSNVLKQTATPKGNNEPLPQFRQSPMAQSVKGGNFVRAQKELLAFQVSQAIQNQCDSSALRPKDANRMSPKTSIEDEFLKLPPVGFMGHRRMRTSRGLITLTTWKPKLSPLVEISP